MRERTILTVNLPLQMLEFAGLEQTGISFEINEDDDVEEEDKAELDDVVNILLLFKSNFDSFISRSSNVSSSLLVNSCIFSEYDSFTYKKINVF